MYENNAIAPIPANETKEATNARMLIADINARLVKALYIAENILTDIRGPVVHESDLDGGTATMIDELLINREIAERICDCLGAISGNLGGKELMKTNQVSRLILNMTTKGATRDELARAIRYSKAVMDAENSYEENEIDDLVRKYMEETGE